MSDCVSQPIITGHLCTSLEELPDEWIITAKEELTIWYGHTSHGSQITTGMQNLMSHYGFPYDYNYSGSGGALSYQEVGGDLGHNGDLTWEATTRNKLNEPGNDRNVVIWSWCGGVSNNTEDGINIYLNAMNQLEIDFPEVKFVYMTGHLDGTGEEGNLHVRNNQIRNYCIANNKILFDFADIESYDPDGNYFLDLYANDNCNYTGGNWAQEWCGANPGSDLCWDCSCAHSQPLNCNLKGRAFWWMISRIAGWTGPTNIESHDDLHLMKLNNYPNPFKDKTTISFSLPEKTKVSLDIFNIHGVKIKSLVSDKWLMLGPHTIIWDATNINRERVPPGIYYYTLITPEQTESKPIILLH